MTSLPSGVGGVVIFGFLALASAAAGEGDSAGGARVVVDGAGRSVRVPVRPSRIVSLAPSVTEVLFALGAGDRVVGVTDFCEHPREAAGRPSIGGLINPDLERIVSLRPDLAVASMSGNYRDDIERIERLGVTVFTIRTFRLKEVLDTIDTVGGLVDRRDEASRLSTSLRQRIASVRAGAEGRRRPRTLFVVEPDPLIAPGGDTFLGEALEVAGADLVTAGAASSWAQFDLEEILRMRPEVILTPQAHRNWAESLPRLERWRLVPAVAAGRIHVVSDAIQHPGPRLVDGIEEVARLLGRAPDGPADEAASLGRGGPVSRRGRPLPAAVGPAPLGAASRPRPLPPGT